ncbi:hypothetical protein [Nocardia sp. NPDC057030]|uniref:hypothetical protein n=1 Tax=unclassified Nocardia TaxID=2637762 RepID=UPI0036324336
MKLDDLFSIPRPGHEEAGTLDEFMAHPLVAELRWPRDVVEQWLWEHGRNAHFLYDYGTVQLDNISWSLETLPAADLVTTPTGLSEGDLLDINAADHAHWVRVRPVEIRQAWDQTGTWLRPPILIERALLTPPADGLQVIEGRTRLGILRGRHRDRLLVADYHHAWVGQRSHDDAH